MSTWTRDMRFALRSFAKNPWFTLVAVMSLAIGIGANTSIFSVANALLFRPLPYEDSGRLAILWNRSLGLGITQDWFSTAQYFDIKSSHHGFEQIAIAIGGNYNLTGRGDPERVGAVRASSNLLTMLGARSALGRLLTQGEDLPGQPPTAVLTDGMWARHFGRDPHVIGTSIIINGQTYEVVGVLSQNFSLPQEVVPLLDGTQQADLFLPLPLAPATASQVRDHEDYNIIGKLRPGVALQQAQAEMDTITAGLRREFPDKYPPNGGLTFSIVPLLEQVVGNVRRALWVLLGSVGFVLLIACANVANLMLSRAVARRQELAVRSALGANRWQIARQLLTESLLLSICGGTIGILLSLFTMQWIRLLGTRSIPRLQDVGIDGRVLVFTLVLSVSSGILFGLVPALRVSRLDLNSTLKDASRGSAGTSAVWGRGNNLRRLLVVAELALSVVLLIGAGLLLRSFVRLQDVSPGFNPRDVLTFDLTMTGRRYNDKESVLNAYRQLWERLENSGAIAVGGVTSLPLSEAFAWTPITVEGRTPLPGEKFLNADERIVAGHYFEAMEIPLRRGRFFNLQDGMTKPVAVIVDEYMADQLWPGQDPIGKRIHIVELPSKDPWQTVVGVVGRVKQDALDTNPRIAFYLSHSQFPARAMTVAVRGRTSPTALLSSTKNELRNLDPDLPMYRVRTMEQQVSESLARRRFLTLLLGIFASVALILAAIGIYGVMAYLVTQGTRELGIRIALGASQRNVLTLVLRQGMALAVSGVMIGLAAAFILTRLIRSLLFGVETTDPITFVGISLLLAMIAFLASYFPAQRAARIDPLISLRSE